MPHAWIFIRTCGELGSGISRSTISKGPLGLDTCTERILYPRITAIYDVQATKSIRAVDRVG